MTPDMHLALYTFGVFINPAEHADNDSFYALEAEILPVVDRASGFVARSGYGDETGPPLWGEQVFPRFYEEKGDGWTPSTLSLWQDIEAAMAFSYFGLHATALKRGREWNVKPQWAPYAAWWCDRDSRPNWGEAVDRLHALHDRGPTSWAFNFKQSFDANGAPVQIDRTRMDFHTQQNASRMTSD